MKDYEVHLIEEFAAGRMSRRQLLRRASVAGISLAALGMVGTKSVRADDPKRGGTIRLAAQFPGKDPQPVTASNAGEFSMNSLAIALRRHPKTQLYTSMGKQGPAKPPPSATRRSNFSRGNFNSRYCFR